MRGKPEYSHLPIIKLLCTIGKKEGAITRCDPHTNGLFSQFQLSQLDPIDVEFQSNVLAAE